MNHHENTDNSSDYDTDTDTDTNTDTDYDYNIDMDWINKLDSLEQHEDDVLYKLEDIFFIKCVFLYVSKDNNIEKIKQEKLLLKERGILSKEEMLYMIKNNCILNQMKYSLLSILKVIIHLPPEDLNIFLKNKMDTSSFLESVKHIDTIHLEKSLPMFHDINSIYILFYEKNKNNTNSVTKRVLIHPKNVTKRKEY